MTAPVDTILSTLPGSDDRQRVVVCHCQQAGGSRIELRQQSFGEGVGWFTQSTVVLEPRQVAGLRAALGTSRSVPATPPTWQPRLVRADIA